jgi:hypothetical protein
MREFGADDEIWQEWLREYREGGQPWVQALLGKDDVRHLLWLAYTRGRCCGKEAAERRVSQKELDEIKAAIDELSPVLRRKRRCVSS